MTGQKTAVFGIFKTSSEAEKAISRLTSAGFSNSDVSLEESNIDGLEEAGVLLAVHCSNSLEIDRANIILEQNGAESISSAGEKVGTLPH